MFLAPEGAIAPWTLARSANPLIVLSVPPVAARLYPATASAATASTIMQIAGIAYAITKMARTVFTSLCHPTLAALRLLFPFSLCRAF